MVSIQHRSTQEKQGGGDSVNMHNSNSSRDSHNSLFCLVSIIRWIVVCDDVDVCNVGLVFSL